MHNLFSQKKDDPLVKTAKWILESSLSEKFTPQGLSILKQIGFEQAPIGKKTYDTKTGPKPVLLYGLPMRAGKWADVFVGMYENGKYFMADLDGVSDYSREQDLTNHLKAIAINESLDHLVEAYHDKKKKMKKEGNTFGDALRKAREAGEDEFEVDGKVYKVKPAKKENVNESSREFEIEIFNAMTGEFEGSWTIPNYSDGVPEEEGALCEVLSPAAPIEDWISDFVHSSDERFKGKTVEERTKMAIAAYYSAGGKTKSESSCGGERKKKK